MPAPPERAVKPPPELRFHRRLSLRAVLRELWDARSVTGVLTERQFRIRYKQAALGVAWAVLSPALYLVVFTVLFQRVADIDTGDIPYPVFAYMGLIPWTFFSTAVSTGALSLVTNVPLLNKVYCPREVFPLSAIGGGLIDTAIASVLLVLLFVIYAVVPQPTSWWAIPLALVGLAFTTGVVLALSIATVYFRDMRHLLPLLLQVGVFATPVAYSLDQLPEKWLPLYAAVNPLAVVIDGLRRSVLEGLPPQGDLLAIAAAVSAVEFLLGYYAFKRFETGIADVA